MQCIVPSRFLFEVSKKKHQDYAPCSLLTHFFIDSVNRRYIILLHWRRLPRIALRMYIGKLCYGDERRISIHAYIKQCEYDKSVNVLQAANQMTNPFLSYQLGNKTIFSQEVFCFEPFYVFQTVVLDHLKAKQADIHMNRYCIKKTKIPIRLIG